MLGWVERMWGRGGLPDGVDECALELDDPSGTVDGRGGLISAARAAERQEMSCTAPTQTTRYFTSVYWALMTISTVGYGDIVAETDIEKLWAVSSMLFGALVFAAITGSLAVCRVPPRSILCSSISIFHHNHLPVDPTGRFAAVESSYSWIYRHGKVHESCTSAAALNRTVGSTGTLTCWSHRFAMVPPWVTVAACACSRA